MIVKPQTDKLFSTSQNGMSTSQWENGGHWPKIDVFKLTIACHERNLDKKLHSLVPRTLNYVERLRNGASLNPAFHKNFEAMKYGPATPGIFEF